MFYVGVFCVAWSARDTSLSTSGRRSDWHSTNQSEQKQKTNAIIQKFISRKAANCIRSAHLSQDLIPLKCDRPKTSLFLLCARNSLWFICSCYFHSCELCSSGLWHNCILSKNNVTLMITFSRHFWLLLPVDRTECVNGVLCFLLLHSTTAHR